MYEFIELGVIKRKQPQRRLWYQQMQTMPDKSIRYDITFDLFPFGNMYLKYIFSTLINSKTLIISVFIKLKKTHNKINKLNICTNFLFHSISNAAIYLKKNFLCKCWPRLWFWWAIRKVQFWVTFIACCTNFMFIVGFQCWADVSTNIFQLYFPLFALFSTDYFGHE